MAVTDKDFIRLCDAVTTVSKAVTQLQDEVFGEDEPETENDEEEEVDAPEFVAFLKDHPEIGHVSIGQRNATVLMNSAKLDRKLDREYVYWGFMRDAKDTPYPFWDNWLTWPHVLEALGRGCRKHGGPITVRQLGEALWGPDGACETQNLGVPLSRDPRIRVERSGKPNRYSLA